MSASPTISCFIANDDETAQLGKTLARYLNPGELVLLDGPLGAGKTALGRAIIRALLNQPALEVPSPTFLLVLPYQNKNISILHADLYRLEDPRELEELGLFEDQNALVLVEWGGRAPELEQLADLVISIEFAPEKAGRKVKICSPKNGASFNELAALDMFGGGK